MFGSAILEVAIGIMFIYILMSIICSAIREGIEAWLKTRAAYLEYGIRELLHDTKAEGIAKSFYNHPLIYSLFADEYKPSASDKRPSVLANGANLPSYIPSKNFALALMDIAVRGPDTDALSSDASAPVVSLAAVRMNILNLKNEAVQRALLTAVDAAQGDLNKAQANIEAWYDSAMDRVSGWYKRSTQWILFCIGFLVAAGLNVNTITIADFLYRDDAARAAMIARADTAATDIAFLSRNYDQVKKDLDSMTLPIGWTAGWGAPRRGNEPYSEGYWNDWIAPFLGWLLTAFAAMMGAPFWFDVLNKVMVIRSTVKPHEKSPEEASEDRQFPTQRTAETMGAGQGGAVAGASPLPPGKNTLSLTDDESGIDGCDVDIVNVTSDEDLPAAEGGVA